MGYFSPKPLRGVNAALKLRVILTAPGARQLVDFGGFAQGGVVFPEHEHGVGVVLKTRFEGQALALRIYRAGRGASGIDGQPNDLLGGHLPGHAAHGGLQAFEVVERVLAKLIFGRVAILELLPARIIVHVLGNFGAGARIHE